MSATGGPPPPPPPYGHGGPPPQFPQPGAPPPGFEAGGTFQQAAFPPPYGPPQSTNGLAIASLICGLLGISIPAVILGHLALRQIKRSDGREGGRGLGIAGLVLGYVGIVFTALIILFAVGIFVIGARSSSSDEARPASSSTDQSACEIELETLEIASEAYKMTYGSYPFSETQLVDDGFLLEESDNFDVMGDGSSLTIVSVSECEPP